MRRPCCCPGPALWSSDRRALDEPVGARNSHNKMSPGSREPCWQLIACQAQPLFKAWADPEEYCIEAEKQGSSKSCWEEAL